jgi:enoyl-CoA hydratase/carnithine racemase
MLLTCRRVAATEGKQMGFVTQLVPEGQALAEAKKCAEIILGSSPMSIRATMERSIDKKRTLTVNFRFFRFYDHTPANTDLLADAYRASPFHGGALRLGNQHF